MSNLAIFDTSVLVDQFRTRCHEQRIQSLTQTLRNSSVVLAELWRGVTSRREREALLEIEENHPILTPTTRNWLDSGQILGQIAKHREFNAHKLRDLHFDLLIALTARSSGARLITSNQTDFELIHHYRPFQLEIWPSPA